MSQYLFPGTGSEKDQQWDPLQTAASVPKWRAT